MKNMFKTSKRGIIIILTLCILLGTTGIGVYATAIPEENTMLTEETTGAIEEIAITTEENIVPVKETAQELVPMMANYCEDDDYYIEGEPDIPMGAMPVGSPTIGSYVSASFLSFVVGLGHPDTGWYYYMEDYRLPNGQLVKYHIWVQDELGLVFHHRR